MRGPARGNRYWEAPSPLPRPARSGGLPGAHRLRQPVADVRELGAGRVGPASPVPRIGGAAPADGVQGESGAARAAVPGRRRRRHPGRRCTRSARRRTRSCGLPAPGLRGGRRRHPMRAMTRARGSVRSAATGHRRRRVAEGLVSTAYFGIRRWPALPVANRPGLHVFLAIQFESLPPWAFDGSSSDLRPGRKETGVPGRLSQTSRRLLLLRGGLLAAGLAAAFFAGAAAFLAGAFAAAAPLAAGPARHGGLEAGAGGEAPEPWWRGS